MGGVAMDAAISKLGPYCPSGNHLLVVLAMAKHTDKHGRGCYASQQTLAEVTLLSRSTVKRCVDDLSRLKVIRPGNWRAAEHIRADRRPEVWDLALDLKDLTRVHIDPSQPLNEGSIDHPTGGQLIYPRGVTVTPKSVKTESAETEPENQSAPASPPPPDWATFAEEGVGVQGEGEECLPQPGDETTLQAAAFVDALPFDRNPTTAERADLIYLACLWFKAGWSHEALMAKCEAGLEGLHDRTRAWIKFRLVADKVCKPPPSAGHQTYKDPPGSAYYDPKAKRNHTGWQNQTDPDPYAGSF